MVKGLHGISNNGVSRLLKAKLPVQAIVPVPPVLIVATSCSVIYGGIRNLPFYFIYVLNLYPRSGDVADIQV